MGHPFVVVVMVVLIGTVRVPSRVRRVVVVIGVVIRVVIGVVIRVVIGVVRIPSVTWLWLVWCACRPRWEASRGLGLSRL